MNITKKNIERLIEERKQTYRNADNAVQAFNDETRITNDYNGRQILEMIQNADDAQAKKIDISIDTNKHVLSIYNDGKPFSYEGIKSIMIANLSGKVSSFYIGNKGMGFRSLIYWADKIQIFTETFIFTFSSEEAAKSAKDLNLDLEEIRKSRNLSPICCPFPMLAIPKVDYLEQGLEKGCKVVIEYKKNYEKNIIEQLDLIEEKALLFLNNVTEMNISGTNINEKKLSIKQEGDNRYLADGIYWLKQTLSKELPEELQDPNKLEKQRYSIQLAIPEDRNAACNVYNLYNYLPTQEKIGLPFIIHATLELNSSRNNINEKDVNRYVLCEVAHFISEYVSERLSEDKEHDWKWYKMITPDERFSSSSQILKETLFSILSQERVLKKLYPTVGAGYVGINEYYYSSIEELKFWDEFREKRGVIKYVLRPFDDIVTMSKRLIKQEDYISSLNSISSVMSLTKEDRANMINFIVRNINLSGFRPWLFIDDNNELIKDESVALFTPKTEGAEYPCPEFVNIRFIDKDLYIMLLELLKQDNFLVVDTQSTTQSRAFCALLRQKNIASVSDYDKSEVLRTIVSQTNKYIETLDDHLATDAIKKMFSCLFNIYVSLGYETNLESVKLLDTEGRIVEATRLLLDSYDNRLVFGNKATYILSHDGWNIDKLDESEYIKFLKLLGVNRLIKDDKVKDLWSYALWLEKLHVIGMSDNPAYTAPNMYKAMNESSLNKMTDLLSGCIKDLSLDKIMYLLATNEELWNCVVNCKETLSFRYKKLYYMGTEYSYLRYQFLQLASVNKKILSTDIVLEELDSKQYLQNLSSEKRDAIMNFLTTNLRGVQEDEIVDILNKLSDEKVIERNKKYVQRIYTLVIDALNKDNRSLKGKNVLLCAKNGEGKIIFLPVSQVYYSDNTCLPKALEKSIGRSRLYYPARKGANKVCKALGIEPVSEFYPSIQSDSIIEHPLNREFMRMIEDIKPYILLYCSKNVDSYKSKQDLAALLRKMKIRLVSECFYQLNGKDNIELNPMEFINSNELFYINAVDVGKVSDMQLSPGYCNLICEILSIATKLEGKDDIFIRIFQNPGFIKEAAVLEFADGIEDAKELMGVSRDELSFWSDILHREITDTDDDFYQSIIQEFELPEDFHFDRVDFRKWLTEESNVLLHKLSTRHSLSNNIDLSYLHRKEFDDTKSTHRLPFVHSLWLCLCSDIDNQKNFIRFQQEYDNIFFDGDKSKLYTKGEYIDYLKEKVRNIYSITWNDASEKHFALYKTDKLNELSIESQSIFYFPYNQDKVNQIIAQLETKTEENDDPFDENMIAEGNGSSLTILEGKDIKKGRLPVYTNMKRSSGKASVYASETDNMKRKAGKRAEIAVCNVLKTNGFEYSWRSGFSNESNKNDKLGYDFTYKGPEEIEWRYLEVKRFNGESFIISKHEFETALKEEFKNRYDLALVYNDQVYIIKNFFESENFQIEPESYSVYCEIKDGL